MNVREYSPFALKGSMGHKGVKGAMNSMKLQKQIVICVYQLFGAELPKVLEAMNRELAA